MEIMKFVLFKYPLDAKYDKGQRLLPKGPLGLFSAKVLFNSTLPNPSANVIFIQPLEIVFHFTSCTKVSKTDNKVS